jgi:chemotaxis protein methyltransferase CheR
MLSMVRTDPGPRTRHASDLAALPRASDLQLICPSRKESTPLQIHDWCFNREPGAFDAFVRWAVPRTLLRHDEPLRVLNAGCGSGEDVYSLAIRLLDRRPGTAPAGVLLHGIDAHADLIAQAKKAEYDSHSLRKLPDAQRAWFKDKGDTFVVDGWVRRGITFEKRDPFEDDPRFWRPGAYHAIFCRDLLVELPREQAARLVDRFSRSLVDGGYLFLGSTESLRGISSEFDLTRSGETTFYRRRERPRMVG